MNLPAKDREAYAICELCAFERGWKPFKTAYTVSMGKCEYCNCGKEEMLTPLRDLKNSEGVRADVAEQRERLGLK